MNLTTQPHLVLRLRMGEAHSSVLPIFYHSVDRNIVFAYYYFCTQFYIKVYNFYCERN